MSPVDYGELDKSTLEKDLQETKDLITNLKSMGADVEAAELIVSQAERALEKGNLEMTKTLIESTVKTFTLIKQQYFIQSASILFSSLQRSIVSLEGAGSEVNYIKDLYNRAKEKFEAGLYEEAMDYMKSAEDMVNDVKEGLPEEHRPVEGEAQEEEATTDVDRSQEQMEAVSQVLIRVEKLLQEATDAGYAVNESEKLYSLAEDAFDYQDYKKAEDYALQSEKTLEDVLKPMRAEREKLETEGESAAEGASKILQEGIPRGEAFTNVSDSYSDIMPKGIIGDAPKDVEDEDKIANDDVMDAELAIEKEATNLLISADEQISTAKESGLNIPMAERLLSIAESYFDRAEFDTVKEYSEKAIQQVKDVMMRKGLGPEEGGEEEEPETETPEPKEKPKEAEAVDKLEAGIHKIKEEIDEAKEMGLPIEDAQELIDNAFEEFAKNRYTGAKDFGIQAKKEIKQVKKDFIKKKALEMVKYAWKEIENAEDVGVDTSVAHELLQESRDLIKLGKFEKAAELAMESMKSVKSE